MRRKRRVVLALASILSTTVNGIAQEAPVVTETRAHFHVTGEGESVIYDVTQITRVADEFQESVHLVRDHGYGDVVMRWKWSYVDQLVTDRLSDTRDRAFLQQTFKAPFTANTRQQTLAEAKANPLLLETLEIVRIETNGGVFDAVSEWRKRGELRAFRHSLRQATNSYLLEAVERMRGTLFLTSMAQHFFVTLGQYVVYDVSSDASTPAVEAVQVTPDCAFDSAFGFPCSRKQLERVKKLKEQPSEVMAY